MIRTTIVLFAFWLVLTGATALSQVVLGLVLATALSFWISRTWTPRDAPPVTVKRLARVATFLPLLLLDVVRGAWQVAIEVLRPRLAIEPVVVERETGLRRDLSRVMLANSISLAPGTMTVDSEEDIITVHCLSGRFAPAVSEGRVEDRVARTFER